MYHPTTRVLTILELLQAHPRLSSAELAERLEVDRRSVRRYIVMLQDLGIPMALCADAKRYRDHPREPWWLPAARRLQAAAADADRRRGAGDHRQPGGGAAPGARG